MEIKLRKVKIEEVGELLDRIYYDELHFAIWWFWDAGMDFSIKANYEKDFEETKVRTSISNIAEVMTQSRDKLIRADNNQSFTKWCNEKFKEES